jgi:predicted nucleic-acid-binding protein
MIAFDTNLLLRLFHESDDPDQTRLVRKALTENAPVFISDIALVEFAWTCRSRFKLDRAMIRRFLSAILNAPEFLFADRDALASAIFRYQDHGDFADWLMAETNRHHGCVTTMTFDNAAAKYADELFALLVS